MADDPEVLIVGAGPAGRRRRRLLLGDLGVRTLVIDKRTEVSTLPRARGIHARAAEILHQLGIEAEMVAHALPIESRMEVRTTLAADPVAVATTGGSEWTEVSPCDGIAIAQGVERALLVAVAGGWGGSLGSATISLGRRDHHNGVEPADRPEPHHRMPWPSRGVWPTTSTASRG